MGASVTDRRHRVVHWGSVVMFVNNYWAQVLQWDSVDSFVSDQRHQMCRCYSRATGTPTIVINSPWFCRLKTVYGRCPLAINGVNCARGNIMSLPQRSPNFQAFLKKKFFVYPGSFQNFIVSS